VIERAVILSDGDVLRVEDQELGGKHEVASAQPSLHRALRDQEQTLIEEVLSTSHGRVSGPRGAAARLGIPSTTLESKIKRFGIDKHKFRSPPRTD
jgi:formate hydrogenlyase transcriptional activator